MPKIKCLWLEPTSFAQVSLRRYQGYREEGPCPASGVKYHDASFVVEPKIDRADKEQYDHSTNILDEYPRDDPRWPKVCPCGFKFPEDANWQVNTQRLYTNPELSDLVVLADAPIGAMWDAWWYDHKGPDGKCIVVKTPGGEWIIDYPCKDGKGWDRTGTPPKLTVKPSIGIGRGEKGGWLYHGWLRDGYLVDA
jgi:hypothetical protein